jgi:hypothetical protein
VTRKAAQLGLVVLMLLAGLMLWLGSPLIWLWIGAQLTDSQQPQFGPYMVIGIGILATTVAIVFALSRLNRIYEQLVGERQTVQVRLPWMRSLSDLRDQRRRTELTVFDAVLVFTALTALTAFVGWFFLFAGSPLPAG